MTRQTTTCTYHCSACGCHFHGLNAFDAHRQGDYASNDPETGRHCVHPLDMDGKLVELTTDGECRMYDDGGPNRGITVWTHGKDLARLRASGRVRRLGPVSDDAQRATAGTAGWPQ